MMKDLKIENIDIPLNLDNIQLKGSVFSTSKTPLKAPWIIILNGFLAHRGSEFVKSFSEKFASVGYYILSYDYRGHGKSAKEYNKLDLYKLTPQIFADIHDVINWVIETQSYRLLKNNLSLFGRSYGGAIVLTHGYIDKNVNKIIALCARYDYLTVQLKISEDLKRTIAEKISPKLVLTNNPSNNKRIMLVHCKDDKIIPFENIIHIKEHLGLNDSNLLIYEKGGHSFEGLHNEIFRSTLEFLKKI